MKKALFSLLLSLFVLPAAFGQVAEWRQYQGPYTGNVMAFSANADTLYCGADLCGVFRSTDGGLTWEHTGLQTGNIQAMYSDSAMVLASAATTTYASFDNGANWSESVGIQNVNRFYTFNGKLYAATEHGIFLYDATADTWQDESTGLPADDGMGARNVKDITNEGNVLFCGTMLNGMYYSTDTAQTWTPVPASSGFSSPQVLHLTNYHDTLFAFPNDVDRTIYLSADTGKTWTGIPFARNDNSFDDVTEYQDTVLIATNKGVYKYNPIDSTFSLFSDKIVNRIYAKDSILLASDHNGLFRWDKATRDFTLSNTGINSARVYALALFDSTLYAATHGGAYYTSDDGESWTEIPEVQNLYCDAFTQLDTTLYMGTSNGLFAKSVHSDNWIPSDSGLTSKVVWALETVDTLLYAATDNGLYKSVDRGQNWLHMKNYSGQILRIAHGNNMILATSNSQLFQVAPDGASLDTISFDRHGNEFSMVGILDSTVYIGLVNDGIYQSSDSCQTWSHSSLPGTANYVFKRGDKNIYVAGFSNIYYSPDNGETWQDWSETGMPHSFINCVLQGDSAMYAGTIGNSIFKREYLKLTDMTSNTYEIADSTITNLPANTTADSLEANIDVSHGASAEVVGGSGGTNASMTNWGSNVLKDASITYLHAGDQIKVIAEDGVTTKIYTIATVTGIETVTSEQPFFYPNPVKERLNISSNYSPDARIVIFDIQGKKVLDQQMTSNQVNVANLPKGVYIVELLDSGKATINKLLKE